MRLGRPDERLGIVVVLIDISSNGFDQLLDAPEHPAADPLVGDLAEPAFDQVQPRAARRDEVEVEPLVTLQLGLDLGVLMGRIVVDDKVEVQIGRRLGVDLLEELDELLVAVPRHALPDQPPLQHVQRGDISFTTFETLH